MSRLCVSILILISFVPFAPFATAAQSIDHRIVSVDLVYVSDFTKSESKKHCTINRLDSELPLSLEGYEGLSVSAPTSVVSFPIEEGDWNPSNTIVPGYRGCLVSYDWPVPSESSVWFAFDGEVVETFTPEELDIDSEIVLLVDDSYRPIARQRSVLLEEWRQGRAKFGSTADKTSLSIGDGQINESGDTDLLTVYLDVEQPGVQYDGQTCSGVGQLSGFTDGRTIKVVNEQGTTVASAALSSTQMSVNGTKCQFMFEVELPYGDYFEIVFAANDTVTVSRSDLEKRGWTIYLSLIH